MNLPLPIQRRLRIAGALFGLTLGAALSWTTILAVWLALRDVPIDADSFGLRDDNVAAIAAISALGPVLGGYLVAHFMERTWLAVLLGALITSTARTLAAYLETLGSLKGSPFAELILFRLPVGLIFGAALWFLGGLLGSAVEWLALNRAAHWFETRRAPLAWALVIGSGLLLGTLAGGTSVQRYDAVAAAQAVHGALRIAGGQSPGSADLPAGFLVSGPALDTLHSFGARIRQPYRIAFSQHTGREVVTDTRFQDGLVVRCVSAGAQISRCFENKAG